MRWNLPRLVVNELKILARDSSSLFWVFLFPFFFMFMMLFAFGREGNLPQQTVEIVDLDGTAISRRYIDEIRRTFSAGESIPAELNMAEEGVPVADGASRVTIPEGFGHYVEQGRPIPVDVSFAQDGLPAQLVVRVMRALTLKFEADVRDHPPAIEVRDDPRGALPALSFVHYILTGTMVMAMLAAGMNSICNSLAYRRERNGFKMLACMPVKASTFLLGMLLARLSMLMLAQCALVVGAHCFFDVPLSLGLGQVLRGGVVMLFGGCMLLALGTAMGARIATLSAATFVTGLVYIALLFLCDLTMPMNAMPPAVSAVMAHLPPALLVDVLRHVFIQGDSFGPHLGSLAEMAGWTGLFALVASLSFRWHEQ
ncbi:ABC transporter permease [Variovorax sp. GT1P44]|uniref:ABC transporter permease n=1 Tax=Variovorax sp. GT1P44 TaxID=3443742 RepID=UPI003F47D1BA